MTYGQKKRRETHSEREVLGNHRRQSQQKWLELGLLFADRFNGANHIHRRRALTPEAFASRLPTSKVEGSNSRRATCEICYVIPNTTASTVRSGSNSTIRDRLYRFAAEKDLKNDNFGRRLSCLAHGILGKTFLALDSEDAERILSRRSHLDLSCFSCSPDQIWCMKPMQIILILVALLWHQRRGTGAHARPHTHGH
jgi:hypothetical protein